MEEKERMRVLLVTDAMGSGGAERQLSYLAIGLKRAGCEVRLMQFYDQEVFYARELAEAGITTEVRTDGQGALARARLIAREVRRWRPTMVVAYKEGSSMAACLAQLLVRFRLVVSERNTTQRLTLRERLKFALYRLATWVVPNSASQGRFIAEHFPRLKPKVRVITNMIDTERFHPASPQPTASPQPSPKGKGGNAGVGGRAFLPDQAQGGVEQSKREKPLPVQQPLPSPPLKERGTVPTVITTARVAPQKNVLGYLRALRMLRDRGVQARFLWYGSPAGYEDYYAQVEALQHELGLDDGYITFCGSSHQIADEYRRADYFCLPSSYEGFANVLCEAMACGLVCCASAVCDNPDILPRPDRLFDPSDPTDIADKLQAMIEASPQPSPKGKGDKPLPGPLLKERGQEADCDDIADHGAAYRAEAADNAARIRSLCSEQSFIEKYLQLAK